MMDKNKISGFLDEYADELKKMGIYLLIIISIFGFSLKTISQRRKALHLKNEQMEQDAIAVDFPEAAQLEDTTDQKQATIDGQEVEISVAQVSPEKLDEASEEMGQPLEEITPSDLQFTWPIQGEIINSYGFGYSKTFADYRFNPGIDIAADKGTEVKASLAGQVVNASMETGQRMVIEIEHQSGVLSYYSHLSEIIVQPGEQVVTGQVLGRIDQPGSEKAGEAALLHFGLQINGDWHNPEEYLAPSETK